LEGAIIGDVLQKLLLMYRPYELELGETERVYNWSVDYVCKEIVNSSQSMGKQLNELRKVLIVCRDRFRG